MDILKKIPFFSLMTTVLTGGAWLGSKTGQTLVLEDNKIRDTAKTAVSNVKTYLILGVVAWVGFVFWKRK